MDKKYLKQVGLYVLASLVSLGLILYIGYHLFYGLTQRVETAPAAPAVIRSAVEADMYLFREEHGLRSALTGGSIVPAVPDGTRLGIGDTAARRYDVSSPDIVAAIAEAEAQIAVLTAMQSNALSVRDTVAIDREIYGILQKIASAGQSGDAASVPSLRTELRAALSRRAIITGAASDIDGEIARIRAKKAELTGQLGKLRETASVTESGYYYASLDGYESVFTADTAKSMTPEQFRTLMQQPPKTVSADAAGKLVTDYVWYAACLVPLSDTEHLAEGGIYSVSFPYNGETSIPMTLTRAVRDGDGMMLVFSADVMPDGFSYTRMQPAEITDNTYEGLKVPSSAVRVVNGITGVYVLEGSVVHYRAVRLLVEGEDWCLLEDAPEEEPPKDLQWLGRNEIVITKGRGLTEGRILS